MTRVSRDMQLPEACQALEATLLRQLLSASNAFKVGTMAGAEMHGQMFMDALADALAKGDGLGIGRMLQRSMDARGGKDGGPDAQALLGLRGLGAGAQGLDAGGSAQDAADARALSDGTGLPATDEDRAILEASVDGDGPTTAPRPARQVASFAGLTITSGYGPRPDPLHGDPRFHTGVDLRADEGAAIRATAPGVVRSVGPRGGYGNAVEIDHGNGVTTLYGHASSLSVAVGQRVAAGDEVGRVGHTGRATGPHLHFEVRQDGRPVDPLIGVKRALNAYVDRADNSTGAKPVR